MIRPRGLLALTADGTRTGATLLLASLLEELGRDGAVDPGLTRVVAGTGGAREPTLTRTVPVRVAVPAADVAGEAAARLHPGARAIGERVGLAWGLVRDLRRDAGPPDLVWAHGASAIRLAAALPRPARRAPLVAYVHDAGVGLRRALGDASPRTGLEPASLVVASSQTVAAHLVEDVGLPVARVAVHRPWVPELGRHGARSVIPRRPPHAPDDALVVAGCGSIGWRRGTDLFLDLAARLPRRVAGRPVHLVWIGGPERIGAGERIRADVAARNLGTRIELVGEVDDLAPWLAGCDLLVATGRTEGLPTAALAAAARGRPVVGWRTSGIAEIFPEGCRPDCLDEAFDGPGLALRVERLLADPDQRHALAAEQQAHVLTHHQAAPAVRDLWADVAAHLARLP